MSTDHGSLEPPPAGVTGERMRARRRWLVGGATLLGAAPLVWAAVTRPLVTGDAGRGASAGGAAKGMGPLVDYEAPDFSLRGPDGKTVELKQFRDRPVLLNFWATWCTPCKEELPEFEHAYRQLKDLRFILLAVSIDSEAGARDVPAYLREGSPKVGPYTFPVALDTKQEVARAYKLSGIPASFFIDRAGVIRAVYPGAMNRQMLEDRLTTIVD